MRTDLGERRRVLERPKPSSDRKDFAQRNPTKQHVRRTEEALAKHD